MRVILAFAFAAVAICARAQVTQTCTDDLTLLQSCAAGGLTGSALGSACCPQIQAVLNDCGGTDGVQMNLLGSIMYQNYWSLLLDVLESDGCPFYIYDFPLCSWFVQTTVNCALAYSHDYSVVNITYVVSRTYDGPACPSSATLTIGGAWEFSLSLLTICGFDLADLINSANIPGVQVFPAPLSVVDFTFDASGSNYVRTNSLKLNSTLYEAAGSPTFSATITDASYPGTVSVSYGGRISTTPANKLTADAPCCSDFISASRTCRGVKIDVSNLTEAGGGDYIPYLMAYQGSCPRLYPGDCYTAVDSVVNCLESAADVTECAPIAAYANRTCFLHDLGTDLTPPPFGMGPRWEASPEYIASALDLMVSAGRQRYYPSGGAACGQQLPGVQMMTLPNGDSVAVTKTCDPSFPNCIPAAQWGDKTWYYYYPQYATEATIADQPIPASECSA